MSGRHEGMAEVTTLEDILNHVEKRMIYRYRAHVDFDDLCQEAKIYAWREWEAGNRDRYEILRIANNRARNLYQDKSGSKPLGKPEASRDGKRDAKGDASKAKIRGFMEEYIALHNKKPTTHEVADGTGMKYANVWHHMKNLQVRREFLNDVEVWSMPFDLEDGTMNPPDNSEFGAFEHQLVRKLVIQDYMSRLPEKERAAVYYKYWEDRTNQGIADGLGGYTAQVGANWLKKGLERLRTLVTIDLDRT
jgi:DNA-directed RNA polymerase specialized sigma24 family protein